MNQNFDKCMEMLLHHDGGFVNHPSDPGGLTNMGVTKKTWDDFYGDDIDEERMRNITVDDIKPIYRTNYWDDVAVSDLPSGVDWAVFDWAVNSGAGKGSEGSPEGRRSLRGRCCWATDTDGCDGVSAARNHQPHSGPSGQLLPITRTLRQVRERVDQTERRDQRTSNRHGSRLTPRPFFSSAHDPSYWLRNTLDLACLATSSAECNFRPCA